MGGSHSAVFRHRYLGYISAGFCQNVDGSHNQVSNVALSIVETLLQNTDAQTGNPLV